MEYPMGARITFADVERVVQKDNAGEPVLREGFVCGETFEHADTVYVPVGTSGGQNIYVDARNIAEVAR